MFKSYQCYRNWIGTGKTGRSDWFTGLAGPISKKDHKTGFFSKPGTEPAGTGRNWTKLVESVKTGRTVRFGLGTHETQFKKKTRK